MGPRQRELLSRVSAADLSSAGSPFATSREIGIGRAMVRASRITYVGELGWALYVPMEFAGDVYDTLSEAGNTLGLVDAGYYAIDSLRLEKGYRAWGRELTPDDTPLEAGLGWAGRFDKGSEFLGRQALLERKGQPLAKRLGRPVLDNPQPLPWGDQALSGDGKLARAAASARPPPPERGVAPRPACGGDDSRGGGALRFGARYGSSDSLPTALACRGEREVDRGARCARSAALC